MVRGRCNYFSFWAIFCPFTPLTAQEIKISKKQNKNYWRYHFTYLYQKLWLDDVRFLRYGAWRTDGRKRWHIVVGAPPKKINISNRVQLSLGWKKNKNCKPNSLIQTLIYRSNICCSKIYQREDLKNNSLTLRLKLRIRYFSHFKYSINSLELQWI